MIKEESGKPFLALADLQKNAGNFTKNT